MIRMKAMLIGQIFLAISQQIEALYCRWQSDLRRPGQLVEIITDNEESKEKQRKGIKQRIMRIWQIIYLVMVENME